jgi:hypothetical protein
MLPDLSHATDWSRAEPKRFAAGQSIGLRLGKPIELALGKPIELALGKPIELADSRGADSACFDTWLSALDKGDIPRGRPPGRGMWRGTAQWDDSTGTVIASTDSAEQ